MSGACLNYRGSKEDSPECCQELEGSSCKERMDKLDLFSVQQRKLRGDLIKVYKINRSIERVESV